ncbi:zinc finger protein 658B-like [Littorina saxatilis]|uniref:zinc finger protein 658B-like n=1 Tax=Littorina saxatilis TaxID=31220 RepID=UPI0038B6311F
MESGETALQVMAVPDDDQVECKVETIKQIVVIEDDVVDLWHTVGASRGLTTDADVCRFLLSLYVSDGQEASLRGVRCGRCNSLLTLVCTTCQLPTQGPSQQGAPSQPCSQNCLPSPLPSHDIPLGQSSPRSKMPLQQAPLSGMSTQESISSNAASTTSKPTTEEVSLTQTLSERDEDSDGFLNMQISEEDSDNEMDFEPEKKGQQRVEKDLANRPSQPEVQTEALKAKKICKTAVVVLHRCDTPLSRNQTVSKDGSNLNNRSVELSKTKGTELAQGSKPTNKHRDNHRPTHTCPTCSEEFVSKRELNIHVKKQACSSAQQVPDGDDHLPTHTCPTCSEEFVSKRELNIHVKKQACSSAQQVPDGDDHLPTHTCPTCSKEFVSKRELNIHVKKQACSSAQQIPDGDDPEGKGDGNVHKDPSANTHKESAAQDGTSLPTAARKTPVNKRRDLMRAAVPDGDDPEGKGDGNVHKDPSANTHKESAAQDGTSLPTAARKTPVDKRDLMRAADKARKADYRKNFLRIQKQKEKNGTLKNTMKQFMLGKFRVQVGRKKTNYYYSHYTCNTCSTVFETARELNAHKYPKERCEPNDGKQGLDAKSLEILARVKERYLLCCPHCTQVFSKKTQLKSHVLTHEEKDEDSFDHCSSEDEDHQQPGTEAPQTGKYAIYGELRHQIGSGKYYSSYTCSQCRKVFKLKSAFNKHMERPTCDDDINDLQFKRFKMEAVVTDAPRVKRKAALNATFVHGDDEQGCEGAEETFDQIDDDEKEDASFSTKKVRRVKYKYNPQKQYKQHTLEEFMAGRYQIYLKEKGAMYSHYTCFNCNTVLETASEYYLHNLGRGNKPCPNPKGDQPPPQPGLDPQSIELLLKIKDKLLYCCPKCNLVFGKYKFLKEHRITHAYTLNSDGKYACSSCQETFSEYEELYQHVDISPRKHKCPVCRTGFISHCQISAHMLSHPDDQRFTKCRRCGETFSRSEIKAHHKTHRDQVKKYTPKIKSICPYCGKGFSSELTLSQHLSVHSDEKPFSCAVCGASYKHKKTLKDHQRIHGEKQLQCAICGEKFYRELWLKLHMENHYHGSQFQCSICGHVFKRKLYHDRHKRRHFLPKKEECNLCGFTSMGKADLRNHMRVHTGEKPFQCSFCSAKFSRQDYLRKHTRIHTGEKPYACKDCGKRFICASSYKLHREKRHRDKLFPCSQCGAVFVDQPRLDLHTEREHLVVTAQQVAPSSSELEQAVASIK